jgi:hypothetical protein
MITFFGLKQPNRGLGWSVSPTQQYYHPPVMITFFGLKQPDRGLGGSVSPTQQYYTPHYDKDFFNLIQHYKETSPMNTSIMPSSGIPPFYIEDQVLMNPANDDAPSSLIPIRSESLHPTSDWPQIWLYVRTRGLGSELSSFLFKLLHGFLPTQDRVSRIGMSDNELPRVCLHCRVATGN